MRSPARLLAALGLLVAPLAARPQVSTDPASVFDKVEAMVPVRDGVRLQTEVSLPKRATLHPGPAERARPVPVRRS